MRKIIIKAGKINIHATLNDTVAAKDFEKRLPFSVTCHDSGIDYSGSAVVCRFNPTEIQKGWQNGDISLGGGWFAILYDGEEQSESYDQMMIIGHIDDLEEVKKLPDTIKVTIALEE